MIDLIFSFFGGSQLVTWSVGALAALVGVFGYGRLQRRAGRKQEALRRRMGDMTEAKDTRRKLDEADRDGDALERLRERDRLRD